MYISISIISSLKSAVLCTLLLKTLYVFDWHQGLKGGLGNVGKVSTTEIQPKLKADVGSIRKCKKTRHRTNMVVWYAADIGRTSSRAAHPILGRHENVGKVSPTDIGPIFLKKADVGPMWKCKAALHRADMVVWYAADIGPTSSRIAHPISVRHENRCRPDVERYIGPTSDRYKMFAGCSLLSFKAVQPSTWQQSPFLDTRFLPDARKNTVKVFR